VLSANAARNLGGKISQKGCRLGNVSVPSDSKKMEIQPHIGADLCHDLSCSSKLFAVRKFPPIKSDESRNQGAFLLMFFQEADHLVFSIIEEANDGNTPLICSNRSFPDYISKVREMLAKSLLLATSTITATPMVFSS